jgi:prepilin-type N-terminal cleavage/methylation domain-containing protein
MGNANTQVSPIMNKAVRRAGFTIVELLIVIVVIAILAAITIVAYNGIQNRARATAVQAEASQAAKKIVLYSATNSGVMPTTIEEAGIVPQANTQYDYLTSAATTGYYCLSVTANGVSAASTSTGGNYSVRCGTNLSDNPSLESGSSTGFSNGWPAGSGINASFAVMDDGGYAGANYRRWTVAGSNTTNGNAFVANTVNVQPSSKLFVSFWVRSSTISSLGIVLYRFPEANGGGTSSQVTASVAPLTATNTWQRRTAVFTFDGTVNSVRLGLRANTNTLVAGQTVDVDAVMIVAGEETYTYADGTTTGWAFDGASGASPSKGPLFTN